MGTPQAYYLTFINNKINMGYQMEMSESKDKYHVCFEKLQKSDSEVSAAPEIIVK